jgi:hypothetical protein
MPPGCVIVGLMTGKMIILTYAIGVDKTVRCEVKKSG